MRPQLHPWLVNGRSGDPALYVEMLFGGPSILCDLGDLSPLGPRHLQKIGHVLLSHAHIDHFIGFDTLLRSAVGRQRKIELVGPPGTADRVFHKLQGYEWDLAHRYAAELLFEVTEVDAHGPSRRAAFRFKERFACEEAPVTPSPDGAVASGAGFAVTAALLQHHGPCLGFAIAEPCHVNVWKSRLAARGLATGPWLQALKRAVMAGAPAETALETPTGPQPLGAVRDLVTVTRGQKIAYVTDVADTPANREAIAALVAGADTLFIESRFAAADRAEADARAHLTTTAAGEIARQARVRRMEPFHFSARYEGDTNWMVEEALAAFRRAPSRCGKEQ